MANIKRRYQFQQRIQVILATNMRKVSDPRLQDATITSVKVSANFQYAKIFWVAPKEKKEEVERGFESAKGYFKYILSESLSCRTMPEIEFLFDASADNYYHISDLLEKAKLKDSLSKNKRKEESIEDNNIENENIEDENINKDID
ncbi:MAG: 30S ribosome-binding factor RbfA [Bdellovibrionota bacterium]